jgi:hypothetical protein
VTEKHEDREGEMAEKYKIDHYKIWEIVPKPVNNKAYNSTDQWHDVPIKIFLKEFVWIANPVHKEKTKTKNHQKYLHENEPFYGIQAG